MIARNKHITTYKDGNTVFHAGSRGYQSPAQKDRDPPHSGVLCEMLEIQDEEWRNAVEGYLNTQRFYVLVEPENFDIALGIYDRLRKEKKVYGVGLINTRDLKNIACQNYS